MLHHACQAKAESEAGINQTVAILRCYQCNDWLRQAKKLVATRNDNDDDTNGSSDDDEKDNSDNNTNNNDDGSENEEDGQQEEHTGNDDAGDDESSSGNESSDEESSTSDDESSKEITDDASSILPAPSGLKATKPPESTPEQPKSPIKPRRLPGTDPIAEAKSKIIVKNRKLQRRKFLEAREKLAQSLENSTSSDSSSDSNDQYSDNDTSECPGPSNPRNQPTLKDHWSPGGTRTQRRTNQEPRSTQKNQPTKTPVNRKTKQSSKSTIRKKRNDKNESKPVRGRKG